MKKAILILFLGFYTIGKSAGVELNIHLRPLQGISSGCTLSIKAVNGYVMKEPDLESYSEGDTVRLITRPAVGYKFSHWEGDASGNRLIADMIMTGNKTVTAVFETWTPPIGIPAPEFGIFETYRVYDDQAKRNPSLTYTQNSEGGYTTHYIDDTHPKATDTNNNFGTPEKPRKTLPKADNIPAGSVIEFHGGPYTIGYLILRVTGTADMPIFIRGASPDERIVINTSSNFYLNSQYVIMENFKMSLCVRSFIDRQAHHISVRNIDSKGLSALSWDGGCSEDIVFYSIYNNSESFDPADGPFDESDGGGIGINLGSNRIWTIDNIITRAGGDAVGGGHAANYTAKNYYVGRNIMHTCGENAIDAKEVDNIIISENVMYNFKGWSSGSDGTAVVFHYGPKYSPKNVWFMYNEIFDCSAKAIQVGGDQMYDVHIIGNLIHDIHNQENTADGYSSWSSQKVYLVNNTFHNVDNAVRSRIDATGAMLFAYNNIFSKVSEGGYHVFISGSNHMANSVIENNLFYQPGGKANIIWGSTPYPLEQFISNTTQGKGCVEGNPLFVNAQEVNFRLQPGSAAINRAAENTLYQQFQDTYKLDIRFDKDGTARPKGSAWDIGAYECSVPLQCTLTVNASNGCVMKSPDKEYYEYGETVRLFSCPNSGHSFVSWEGDATGTRLIADVVMTGNKTVTAVFDTWAPPIGIPAPEFGVFETYRIYDDLANRNTSLTYDQNAEGGYYTHYVDNTSPNSTDTNNPYGTASKPRKTFPSDIVPGSIVELHHGPYSIKLQGLKGTADKPIFIRGAGINDKFTVNAMSGGSYNVMDSKYLIVENALFDGVLIQIGQRNSYISFRHCEINGKDTKPGVYLWTQKDTYQAGELKENIVFYNNNIHDCGQYPASEGSLCAFMIDNFTRNIWIVDNHIYNNGEDGIQILDREQYANITGSQADRIFIGRNIFHHDVENAIDAKGSTNVIISQNEMYGYDVSSSSNGDAIRINDEGYQNNIWILFNTIHDCKYGIGAYGAISPPNIIGNILYNLEGAIINGGTGDVVANVIYNCGRGIEAGNDICIQNNIVSKTTESIISGGSKITNNLFWLNGKQADCINCITEDPLFTNAANYDFSLKAESPAINRGVISDVYQIFFNHFGIDIKKDITGRSRPQYEVMDIGAYEYKYAGDDAEPPTQPDGLSATSVTQSSFNFSWEASSDNVGVTGYEVFKDGVSLGTTTSTSMPITGLTAFTTVTMTVRASDAARNWSAQSIALNVTTEAQTDFLAPGIPTGLVAGNISASGFTLSWYASTDDVGVTGYDVYKNDTLIASVTVNSATIAGLKPSAACSMTVKARDAAGNISGPSAALEVTTLSGWTTTAKFQSFDVSTQTGIFTAEFDAIPNSANMDGVTAIINGTATKYGDLACSVLFDVSGKVKALNGSSYSSANDLFYTVGKKYHFRMVINVPEHTYSIYVTPQDGIEVTLGMDYAFRTSQAGVTQLTGWAFIAETGSHIISNMTFSIGEGVGIMDPSWKNTGLRVFPNPASGKITIAITNNIGFVFEIRIYSSTGQLVYKDTNLKMDQSVIDISGFNPGVYLINVTDGQHHQIQQIIKI